MNLDDNIILNMEDGTNHVEFDLEKLQSELDYNDKITNYDSILREIIEYTVKQLQLICEYYGILKGVKMCKFKKNDIIETIIVFETNPANETVVSRRRQLWDWMNQLKKEKVLKKCIIWPITN